MTASPVLTLDQVAFTYPNGQVVFQGLDLEAADGEFLAILGPSGCGKSTLLDLMAGFRSPQSGQVRLLGQAPTPECPALGYVFQTAQLFPWLNVLDNVCFGLRMAGSLSPQAQRQQAMAALERVGLAAVAERSPLQLSGGMRQRVALARALVLEPRVLLMDEPFAALDAISRGQLNEETLALWSRLGQTVIFITHDIDEAVFLADRVVVLNRAPGGIHCQVRIDLPRPRRLQDTRRLPAFMAYRNDLMDRIAAMMAVESDLLPTTRES